MNHRANRQQVSSAHLDFDPSIVRRLTPSDAELPADPERRKTLIHAVRVAWNTMLTEMQRIYMHEYYSNRKTMQHIAEEYGVTRGTVSRTLSRARCHLRRVLQCYL